MYNILKQIDTQQNNYQDENQKQTKKQTMKIDKILFKNTNVEFYVKGKGKTKTIVLLHGYMESFNVWGNFADKLSENYQIVAIDIIGHGNSGIVQDIHSIELMAEAVDEVIKYLKIKKFTLIGHSMGGYVTLEYLSKHQEKLESYCLFHSTPFADTEEKKAEREHIIELIKQGKKTQLAKKHVEKTFADINIKKYSTEIGFFKIIAVNTPDKGVIAALQGMKNRKDYYSVMKHTHIKGLWILGKQDNFININSINEIEIPSNCQLKILEKSGHQGYVEELEKSVSIIYDFLR